MKKYVEEFEKCREKEGPACVAACPFSFDILAFLDKIENGNWDRAYKIYKEAVIFPDIVSRICGENCGCACVRSEIDGAVQLKLLERTCVEKAKMKASSKYRIPPKNKKIGIIGAGPMGLACASVLSGKNYGVHIFEEAAAIGGQLEEILPKEIYMADIEKNINTEYCKIETKVNTDDIIKSYQFDYVYNAVEDKELDAASAIAEGIRAAKKIELFFKTGRKIEDFAEKPYFVPNADKISVQKTIVPEGEIFTEEEAKAEAGRCIRCQCDSCRQDCDLSAFYKKWPSEMKEEIITTVMPSKSMIHKVYARMIHSCTQCGRMEKTCPAGIQLGEMFLEARKAMHRQDKTPPAYHGFWLEDMRHADSDECSLCMNAPGTEKSSYVFFPGCNLGADDPQYVIKTYDWLIKNFGDVGIILRCCGIHGKWAGNEMLYEEKVSQIRDKWNMLGKPRFITACPACQKHLNEAIPEVRAISIYELMLNKEKWPVPEKRVLQGKTTIFDPCAASDNINMKKAIRKCLEHVGISVKEMPDSESGRCCGYGGDIAEANPQFAEYVARKRVSEMEESCITYCVNCRDIFAEKGKNTVHILDIQFDINPTGRKDVDYTDRRNNREYTKKKLLERYWNGMLKEEQSVDNKNIKVFISDEIKTKMKKLRLHEDNIKDVILKSREKKRRVYDKANDEYICYANLGYVTCWVRYKENRHGFSIKNVYTHRMNIKLEEVWNGRKVDTDL